MIAVEINTALNTYFTSLGDPYDKIDIYPLSAYEDTPAPFIVYFEYPGTQNDEQYFLKVSNVVYYIYDNDISRMKNIGWKLDRFLNVGDNIGQIISYMNLPSEYGEIRYRLTTSRKVAGSMLPPIEREGFAMQSLNFRMVYTDM